MVVDEFKTFEFTISNCCTFTNLLCMKIFYYPYIRYKLENCCYKGADGILPISFIKNDGLTQVNNINNLVFLKLIYCLIVESEKNSGQGGHDIVLMHQFS